MTALQASDLIPQLNKLWALQESDREKGVKLLTKIYGNILNNPSNQKFRDLNFSKIRQKLDSCRPAFYLLFTAGFSQNMDGSRLQWNNNQLTMKKLQDANNALHAKIKGEDIENIGSEYGTVIDPEKTSLITNRTMNIHKAKKEKKRLQKLEDEANNNAANAAVNADNDNDNDDDVDMNDDETRKAINMSMEQDGDNNDDNNNDETPESNTLEATKGDGLSAEDQSLIDQIRAAKGVFTTLKASDLKTLSAEEKKQRVKELKDQFRKEKKQSAVRASIAKQKARRDNIHKNQDAERKRKEHQLKQVARQRKKEKEFQKKQHERVMAKIQAQKEQRKRQEALKKKKEEAAKKAKQEQNQ